MEPPREVIACYERFPEETRLSSGPSVLEFERTKDILTRMLPKPPAWIIDVGGAAGAYSAWLAERGTKSIWRTSRRLDRSWLYNGAGLPIRNGTGSLQETHMGMLDGLLGGIAGGAMMSVVNSVLEQHGGLQGVIGQFERNGLGATVQSWVGSGPNEPISPDEVHRTLGPELLQQLSEKSGLSVQDLAEKLSQVLPQAVDRLTPNGAIPKP